MIFKALYPSISFLLSSSGLQGGWSTYPAATRQEMEYTLDRSPSTHIHSCRHFRITNQPSLNTWRACANATWMGDSNPTHPL